MLTENSRTDEKKASRRNAFCLSLFSFSAFTIKSYSNF